MQLLKATRLFHYATVALLVAFVFTACGDQPFGIFAELEREADAEDSDFIGARLRGMARISMDNGTDRYIVASGRPKWRRVDPDDAGNWSNAPRPSGFSGSGDWMTSVVTVENNGDDDVYALFRDHSRDNYEVFHWEDGSWTSVVKLGDFSDAKQITRLFGLNGELFASTSASTDGGPFSLYHIDLDNGSTDPTRVSDQTSSKPFSDATFGADTYYFVSRDGLWYGGDLSTDDIAKDTESNVPSGELDDPPHDNRGVFFHEHNGEDRLYISSNEAVYRTQLENGSPEEWNRVSRSDRGDRFTRFAFYEPDGTDGYIYVGSDRKGGGTNGGVYKLDLSDDFEDQRFRRETGRPDGSQIYRTHLAEFFVDDVVDDDTSETRKHIFALMYSRAGQSEPGMWRRTDDDDWSAE